MSGFSAALLRDTESLVRNVNTNFASVLQDLESSQVTTFIYELMQTIR